MTKGTLYSSQYPKQRCSSNILETAYDHLAISEDPKTRLLFSENGNSGFFPYTSEVEIKMNLALFFFATFSKFSVPFVFVINVKYLPPYRGIFEAARCIMTFTFLNTSCILFVFVISNL